jgi:hypothetical protein
MAKSIIVRLKKTRHKSQPWIFEIDMPGPQKGQTKRERYATKWSAKRGAIRALNMDWRGANPHLKYGKWAGGKYRDVTFILDARKVTKRITNPVK